MHNQEITAAAPEAADALNTPALPGQKFQTARVAIISASHGVHDTYTAFLPPMLPVLIQNLALAKAEAGLLASFLQMPSLLQPFIGYLADRIDLRYLVIFAPAVSATLMSLLGIAPSYLVLVLLILVVGISSASLHSVAPVMAGNLSGSLLGRGMSFFMVGGELGRTLGPVVVVTAIAVLGLRGMPWIMLAGWLASLLLFILLKDVPARLPNAGQSESLRAALGEMKPILLPLAGVLLARSFMAAGVATFLPTFLTEQGAQLWFAGASLSVMEASGVIGTLLGGSISDRFGRRVILLFSFLVTPLVMAAFLFLDGWGRLLALMALGFALLSSGPVLLAMMMENFPQNRAFANGVYMLLSFGTYSLAVISVGLLGDWFGLWQAFAASAAAMLLGLPVILLLPKRNGQIAAQR